jgi:Right handed beta helix region
MNRQKFVLIGSVFWLQAAVSGQSVSAATYYVSPGGNDANPGTESSPFQTFGKAQTVVRSIPKNEATTVYIRKGTYSLTQPLAFNEADSGQPGAKVRWQGYPGEDVVISGGRSLSGWTAVGDGSYKASAQGLNFRQLYINGKRAIRARTPNLGSGKDYFRLRGPILNDPNNPYSAYNKPEKLIGVSCEDMAGVPIGAEQVIQRSWNQARVRIAGSNCSAGNFAWVYHQEPDRSILFDNADDGVSYSSQSYHMEGAKEFLDSPGEWFLDKNADTVYYRPLAGEAIGQATAPVLETVLEVKGLNRAYDGPSSPVHDLEFAGLTFQDTGWTFADGQGYQGIQAGIMKFSKNGQIIDSTAQRNPTPSAVKLSFTKDVLFENNQFQHIGGDGINLFLGNLRTNLNRNVITDISGNCVTVEGGIVNTGADSERVVDNTISNNRISRCAQDYYGSAGIAGYFMSGLKIVHNELSDMPFSAISLGWGHTTDKTNLQDNWVSQNNIHDVVKLLNDGGAVYALSYQPGTVIEKNWIHSIVRSPWTHVYPVAGVYLDNGASGITVRDNAIEANTATRPQGGLQSVRLFESVVEQTRGLPAQNNSISNNDGVDQNTINSAGPQ